MDWKHQFVGYLLAVGLCLFATTFAKALMALRDDLSLLQPRVHWFVALVLCLAGFKLVGRIFAYCGDNIRLSAFFLTCLFWLVAAPPVTRAYFRLFRSKAPMAGASAE